MIQIWTTQLLLLLLMDSGQAKKHAGTLLISVTPIPTVAENDGEWQRQCCETDIP